MEIGRQSAHASRTVEAKLTIGPTMGTWTITFRSEAVPGTLAAFAGTLAAARLDIISALIAVGSDGTVTDSFDVVPLSRHPLNSEDANGLAELAAQILNGTRDLSADLRELRHRYPPETGIVPQVAITTDSELTTGINVVCADRPGLLYDITATLTEHHMRTRSLSVLTFNRRAHDTFRVVDAGGAPPKDERLLGELKVRLLEVCAQ